MAAFSATSQRLEPISFCEGCFFKSQSPNPKPRSQFTGRWLGFGAWDLELGICRCLPDPTSGHTGLACFFLDVGDRFRVRLDLLLHTIEFSECLLPVVSDLCALCGVGARSEGGRQRIDESLPRVRQRLL